MRFAADFGVGFRVGALACPRAVAVKSEDEERERERRGGRKEE